MADGVALYTSQNATGYECVFKYGTSRSETLRAEQGFTYSYVSAGGGSSCGRLWCCSCRVVCSVVLFLLCVCVCDLFLFLRIPVAQPHRYESRIPPIQSCI